MRKVKTILLICIWSVLASAHMAQTPTPTPPIAVKIVERDEQPVKVVQSGPVTMSLPLGIWVAWFISIAAGLGAVAAIWKFAIKAAQIVTDITQYSSVLRDIAKEFKNNAGSTLKDVLDKIEKAVELSQHTADLAQKAVDNLEELVKDNAARDERRAKEKRERDRRS